MSSGAVLLHSPLVRDVLRMALQPLPQGLWIDRGHIVCHGFDPRRGVALRQDTDQHVRHGGMLHYPGQARALYQALQNDPFYQHLERNLNQGDEARDAMLSYYDLSMRDAARWGRLTLPDDGSYGAAVWNIPLKAHDAATRRDERAQALEEALGAQGVRAYQDMCRPIEAREAEMGLEAHWYLSILGVDPAFQGRGLGAKLLHPVLKEIDDAGAKSFITTFSPGNIRFYEGLGYSVAARFSDEQTGSAFSVLTREAPS